MFYSPELHEDLVATLSALFEFNPKAVFLTAYHPRRYVSFSLFFLLSLYFLLSFLLGFVLAHVRSYAAHASQFRSVAAHSSGQVAARFSHNRSQARQCLLQRQLNIHLFLHSQLQLQVQVLPQLQVRLQLQLQQQQVVQVHIQFQLQLQLQVHVQ